MTATGAQAQARQRRLQQVWGVSPLDEAFRYELFIIPDGDANPGGYADVHKIEICDYMSYWNRTNIECHLKSCIRGTDDFPANPRSELTQLFCKVSIWILDNEIHCFSCSCFASIMSNLQDRSFTLTHFHFHPGCSSAWATCRTRPTSA